MAADVAIASPGSVDAVAPARGLKNPRNKVVLLTIVMVVPLTLLFLAIPDPTEALRDTPTGMVGLVLLAFVISEKLVFHIEARNEAVSFSPIDLPLAFGILMLAPMELLAARLIGAAIGMIVWRRPPLFKFVFNLVSFAVETLIAMVLYRHLFGDMEPSPITWLGLTGSVLVALMAGGVLIAVAISFFEGELVARVRKEVTHSYLFYLPGAVLGASSTIPLLVEPWLGVVFIIPAPLVWLVLRSHGSLMHRYTDLTHIHDFSSQVGRSAHPQDIAQTAVAEIAVLLRAEDVALRVFDKGAGVVEARVGERPLLEELPNAISDATWSVALRSRSTVLLETTATSDPAGLVLGELGVREALVVALSDDSGPLGVLVVADRHGAVDRFSPDDSERLHAISQQLVVALRKGLFHVQIQHEATHDRLTGLPNRAYFEAWSQQLFAGDLMSEHAVFMLDLDRFKEVNDTLGHHTGDLLLLEVTARLRSCIADEDLASRFGGDEFAVVLAGAGEDRAAEVATRISEALERPFQLGEAVVAIAGSIGIALAPSHGEDPATLLRHADVAMYDAKRRHERYTVYRDDLEGNDSVRLSLLGDLRQAIAEKSLSVYFQPKLDLRTGLVDGVEALARWIHPTHGFVGPDVFIPLAEQAGLIEQLTQVVLDKSLDTVKHWTAEGYEIGVAVNVSAQSLVDEKLPWLVAASLQRSGVDPRLLTLEITESTMMGDSGRTVRILEQLDDLGVKTSVDDFGTGFSSLVNLRHLPISELKIDRSFVSEMLVGRNDEVIVRSIIDLGHNLGVSVIAEGVETNAVLERLNQMGCDRVQGYGICRPLPVEELDPWLADSLMAVRKGGSELPEPAPKHIAF